MVGARLRQREFTPRLRLLIHLLEYRVALGIRRRHHVPIHVAAGRNGIQQHLVHLLDQRLHVPLQNSVELKCLPRRHAKGRRSEFLGEPVQGQPLLRRRSPAGQPNADHESEGLFLALLLQRCTPIPIILQIESMKLCQLAILLGDRPG